MVRNAVNLEVVLVDMWKWTQGMVLRSSCVVRGAMAGAATACAVVVPLGFICVMAVYAWGLCAQFCCYCQQAVLGQLS